MRKRRRLFRFESLEARRLLAVDLDVYVSAGDLFIRGEGLADITAADVNISQTGTTITIDTDADTTFNGMASVSFDTITDAITDDVHVILLGTVDTVVEITDLQVPDELRILTGDGDDNVSLSGNNNTGGNLYATMGAGTNILTLNIVDIGGQLAFSAAAGGDDTVTIDGGTADSVNLKLGDGTNAVNTFNNFAVTGNAVIVGGAGVDTVTITGTNTVGGDLAVGLAAGANVTSITGATVTGSVSYGGAADVDTVTITGGSVGVDLAINGRAGNNVVTVDTVDVGDDLIVEGGLDNDNVSITGAIAAEVAGELLLFLGQGNNVAAVTTLTVGGNARVAVGDGDDILCLDSLTTTLRLLVDLAAGDNTVGIDGATIGHRLEILAGLGADDIGIANSSSLRAEIDTGAGIDRVGLDTMTTVGTIGINTGADADQVGVIGSTVGFALHVATEAGADVVAIRTTDATDQVDVDSGADADVVELKDVGSVTSDVNVDTGDGDDDLLLNATAVGAATVAGNIALLTGLGDDEIALLEDVAGGFAVAGAFTLDAGGEVVQDTLNDPDTLVAAPVSVEGANALAVADFDTIIDPLIAALAADIAAACP